LNVTELQVGAAAPDFKLKDVNGDEFSLAEALRHGPVAAAFFKVSCPTCQYAFPFLERIYRQSVGKGVTLVAVSQNSRPDTQDFLNRFGITFPVLLDPEGTFPASRAYKITYVPTVFFIGTDGKIEQSIVSWHRGDYESLNSALASASGKPPAPLVQAGETVQDFKAG
jgi:peroxiredoxin